MKNIIRCLKDSVEAIGIPFYYGMAEELNKLLDNADYPCALAVAVNQGNVVQENGQFKECITFVLSFADLTEFDFDSLENEDIITECKERAFKWLSSMQSNGDIRVASINGTTRDYIAYDAIITGYGLNVTLDEVRGVGRCDFSRR